MNSVPDEKNAIQDKDLENIDFDNIQRETPLLNEASHYTEEEEGEIFKFFVSHTFTDFVKEISKILVEKDYYCLCFFYHRLAYVLRKEGNPLFKSEEAYKAPQTNSEHIYDIVKLFVAIINGKHQTEQKNPGADEKTQTRAA